MYGGKPILGTGGGALAVTGFVDETVGLVALAIVAIGAGLLFLRAQRIRRAQDVA